MLMKNEIFDLGMIFTLQKIIIILCVNYCMLHVKQPDMCLVSGLKQNPSQACPRTPYKLAPSALIITPYFPSHRVGISDMYS